MFPKFLSSVSRHFQQENSLGRTEKKRDLTPRSGVYSDALLVGFMIFLQDKNLVFVFQMTLCSILILQKETEMRHP